MTRVAFSVWNERISPVFDVSQKALVLEIENGAVTSRDERVLPDVDPLRKVEKLADDKVRELVCGAISRSLAEMVQSRGIELVPFIAGAIEDVIQAYLQNELPNDAMVMPGCCYERARTRRVRRRGIGSKRNGFTNEEQSSSIRREAMPKGDGTGPQGKGPGTGKGMGRGGGAGPKRPAGRPGPGQGGGGGMGQGRASGRGRRNKSK